MSKNWGYLCSITLLLCYILVFYFNTLFFSLVISSVLPKFYHSFPPIWVGKSFIFTIFLLIEALKCKNVLKLLFSLHFKVLAILIFCSYLVTSIFNVAFSFVIYEIFESVIIDFQSYGLLVMYLLET